MKKLLLTSLLFILPFVFISSGFSQSVPQGISYQAIARDGSGNTLPNQTIGVHITIRKGNTFGVIVYQEAHNIATNQFGLFTLIIGTGVNTNVGSAINFSKIEWGSDEHFLQVEADFGSGYVNLGASELLSVPYALVADSALKSPASYLNTLEDVNSFGLGIGDVLKWDGLNWVPGEDEGFQNSPAGGDLTGLYPDPSINGVQGIPIITTGISQNMALVFDGIKFVPMSIDLDPTDDLNTNSPIGGDLSGTIGNATVTSIQGGAVNAANPDFGDVLTWNGNAWVKEALSGDLEGSVNNTLVVGLQGYPVSSIPPVDKQGLVWSGISGQWIPSSVDSDESNDLTITTSFGGDVSGLYNNITVHSIKNVPVDLSSGIGVDQILKFNGTAWIPSEYDSNPFDDLMETDLVNPSGDVSGSFQSGLTVNGIQGNEVVSTPPSDGSLLKYSVVSGKWELGVDQGTAYTAGSGIDIDAGNVITNLGDSDPNDDLLVSSIAGGDVSGTFNAISVEKIQGYSVSNSPPNAFNNVLVWNSPFSRWEPTSGVDIDASDDITSASVAGGDLTGNFPNPSIGLGVVDGTNIMDNSIGTSDILSPGTGNQVMITNNSGNVQWADQTALSLSLTGPAGGDLSGTYPNPDIAIGAVGSNEILDGSVGLLDISAGPNSTFLITDNLGQPQWQTMSGLFSMSLADGHIWIGDNTNTGSPQLLSGDFSISNTGVGTISNSAITSTKIAFGAVTSAEIAPGAVGSSELANDAVTTSKIAAGGVTNTDIAPNAVESSHIAPNAVSSSEIMDGSVNTIDISNYTIKPEDIESPGTVEKVLVNTASGTVAWQNKADFASSGLASAQILVGNPAGIATPVSMNGDMILNSNGTATISSNAVSSSEILDNSISGVDIQNNSLTSSQIMDGSINPVDIASNSITSNEIAPASIVGGDIGNGEISSLQIQDFTIQNSDLALSSVETGNIVDGQVFSVDLADNNVSSIDIADGTIQSVDIADGAVTSLQIGNSSIQTNDISPAVGLNQILVTDGSGSVNWISQSAIDLGPAGGDLVGTFPNPNIGPNAVGSAEIINSSVTNLDLSSNSVNSSNIINGAITPIDMQSPGLNSQVLVTDALGNVAWESQTTMVASPIGPAGGDLSGNYPNPEIAANSVGMVELADNSVGVSEIALNAVGSSEVIDGSLLSDDIAVGGITSSNILNSTILNEDIAPSAINSLLIANGSVQSVDIDTNAVTTTNILDFTIQGIDIISNTITPDKIAPAPMNSFLSTQTGIVQWVDASSLLSSDLADGHLLIGDGAGIASQVPASGDVSVSNSGSFSINNSVIESSNIVDGSISAVDIGSGQVGISNLSPSILGDGLVVGGGAFNVNVDNLTLEINGSNQVQVKNDGISSLQIANDAVTSSEILDGSVDTQDLTDGAVTSIKIEDDAIISDDIRDLTIQTIDLMDQSVTSDKIGDQSIMPIDIAPGAANTVLVSDGLNNNWIPYETLSDKDWEISGSVLQPDPGSGATSVDVPFETSISSNAALSPALTVTNSLGGTGMRVNQGGAIVSALSPVNPALILNHKGATGNIIEMNGGPTLTSVFTTSVDGATSVTSGPTSTGPTMNLRQDDLSQPILNLQASVNTIHSVTSSQANFEVNLDVNALLETDDFKMTSTSGTVGEVLLSNSVAGDASWGKIDAPLGISPSPNPGWVLVTNGAGTAVEWVDPTLTLDNDWVETSGVMMPGSPTTSQVAVNIDDINPVFSIQNTLGTGIQVVDGGALVNNWTGNILELQGNNIPRLNVSNTGATSIWSNDSQGLEVTQDLVSSNLASFIDNSSGSPIQRMELQQNGDALIQPEGGIGTLGLHVNQLTNGGEILRVENNSTPQKRFSIGTNGNGSLNVSDIGVGLEVIQHSTGDLLSLETTVNPEFSVGNDGTTTIHGNVVPAVSASFNLGTMANRWENLYLSGGVLVSSDKRLKKDISPLNYGLNEVLNLNPVSYSYKADKSEKVHLGLIAQDTKELIDEVVAEGIDSKKLLSVNYSELIPVLIKAIQEQHLLIDSQTQKIESLYSKSSEYSSQRSLIEQLNQRLQQLEEILLHELVDNNQSK